MIDARRAALRAALRSGDVPTAARAASRARLTTIRLDPYEASLARRARRRLGHAIRVARAARNAPPPGTSGRGAEFAPALKTLSRGRRFVTAATITAAAFVVALLVPNPPAVIETQTTAAGPEPAASPSEVPAFSGGGAPDSPISRGRVVKAPPPSPTPQPSASPSPSPSPAPTRSAVAIGARPSGPVTPGGGSGGSGGPGVGPSGGPSAGPSLGPYRPGPLLPGFVRVVGRVVDLTTSRPLSDVCLRLGFGCLPLQPHTDEFGVFIVDLPVGGGAITWDMSFERIGYASTSVVLTPNRTQRVYFLNDVRIRQLP